MPLNLRNLANLDAVIAKLRRPSRYVQIGLVCALLTNSIIMTLDYLGAHYLIGTIIAAVVATPVGFLLHCAYTYRAMPTLAGFFRFIAATAVGSCLAILIMVVLCDGLGLTATMAIPIATVLMFFWNYVMTGWAILRAPVERKKS